MSYAGTVVEGGRLRHKGRKSLGYGRYDRIVRMIEDSGKALKSDAESQAYHLADRLVPYSLGATLLTWLITRNPDKGACHTHGRFQLRAEASMPIAVLSAMRERRARHIRQGRQIP